MLSPIEGVSTRQMRLKVLYTFDAESKNNCLARWPHVLDVQTAFVEGFTQIGVIDLRTCLQALASGSPELLSQDGLDYTVYAYDYSEEGTPLSGQGMLSSVFDQNTQNDSGDTSSKVITGRVTNNVLGFFSGSASETLEVKLRLLPIVRQGQSRGQTAGQTFNLGDNQNFSGQAWPNSGSSFRRQSVGGSVSPVDTAGFENMQRMLHEGNVPRELSVNRSSQSLRESSNSRPGSRSGTPLPVQNFNAPPRQSSSHASRPGSRASVRASTQAISHKRRDSFNSGYYSGDEIQVEEYPPKKRARVTQVGAPDRSDLNIERQPESLRMAASTASSVRVHRPVAVNPTLSNLQVGNLAEEPVRPPTPIPGAKMPVNRRHQTEPSSLRRGSQHFPPSDMSHNSHLPPDAVGPLATSPEFTRGPSVASTPANIPSSPPVMANYGSMPSSPMLPAPPNDQPDSGFMSAFDDMAGAEGGFVFNEYIHLGGHDEFQLQPTMDQVAATTMLNQFTPVFEEDNNVEQEPAQVALPPPPKPANHPNTSKRPISRAQSSRPAIRPAMSSPKLAPAPFPRARQLEEERAVQSTLPPVPSSDPVGRQLHRSNTWAGDMSDAPMSDTPTGEGGRTKSVSSKKVGREQTKARLENALASGEMPPYCDNCGTIDTPAWRRVFARMLPGHLYDSLELWPETPGAFVWKKVVEEAKDGSIVTFKAYKLSKRPEDKGDEWTNVTLCNPCGLWFHKNKCMRPEEKWSKNPKDPNQKKKRAYRPKSKRVAAKKGQDDDSKSEAAEPGSEGSSPADGATEAEMDVDDNQQRNADAGEPQLQPNLGRATSAEPTTTIRKTADANHPSVGQQARAFQSSPVRDEGSHTHPIEVGLTPKPLRRQLFPSPTSKSATKSPSAAEKDKAAMPLGELPNVYRRSPRLNKSMDVLGSQPKTPDVNDKENQFSRTVHDNDLNDLFNDDEDGLQLPPQTPTPARRSDRLLLKTPNQTPSERTRTPGAHTSPSAHRGSSNTKTPKRDFIMGSNRTVEEMTPFTRIIHEELQKDAAAKKQAAAAAEAEVEAQRQLARIPPAQHSGSDFADLPSLNGTSPTARQLASLNDIDFSSMVNEYSDIFRADLTGGSSPSNGFYNFVNSDYIDPTLGGGGGGGQWDGATQMNVQTQSAAPSLAVQEMTGLRRSPRKNKLG